MNIISKQNCAGSSKNILILKLGLQNLLEVQCSIHIGALSAEDIFDVKTKDPRKRWIWIGTMKLKNYSIDSMDGVKSVMADVERLKEKAAWFPI